MTTVRAASAALAGRQSGWIAGMEPWRGLGYSGAGLAKFLRRAAGAGQVWIACAGKRGPALGLLVLQPGMLMGNFVALLAVRPEVAGRGIGRVLVGHAQVRTFAPTLDDRRWLFVSADAANRGALAFYRKSGFKRVGRLPDLIREGRTEILLRKGRADRRGGRR